MRKLHAVVLGATLLLAVSACGLVTLGTAPGGGDAGPDATVDVGTDDVVANDVKAPDGAGDAQVDSSADGGTPDAGDAAPDAPSCDASVGDGGVVLLPPMDAGCPMGTTEEILATSPQAGAGACTCGACTPTTDPSCSGNNLGLTWGLSNQCSGGNDSYNVTDNTCVDFGYGNFTITSYHGWTARTPTAGTCTAPAVPDATKVTTTSLRTCVPSAPAQVCAAEQQGGYRFCIDSGGMACAAPYTASVDVGSGPAVTCAACGCARTAAKCTVEYHGSSQCNQAPKWITEANGVCTQSNGATGVNHFKVFPTGLTCTATPGQATPGLANARKLCCTP